ncbi:exodeoxyribonuclease III [Geothermobacter hydrogeniphilus]|uniref:Exodeoxyribonuclease III n=1 Tax=Geothermobacter hydrogeniphilus TaxID=1969733 RepID=A0A1X0YCW5_9BACT|nr:exodeoxyribonuclease III [Geothermobacter hydrogeniphilus]ORJ62942.1 exodeoxyribonuclease III [Geothermobacter hydrogeniphilus]
MKIVSFNVNGIRARLHQLAALVESHAPDIIGLQETKVRDVEFPVDAIHDLGYRVVFHGQKSHYGVALLSKQEAKNPRKGFPGEDDDAQRRCVMGDFALADGRMLRVINGYFPQGESREHPTKFPAKRDFYVNLQAFLDQACDPAGPLVVLGDMNVAPFDSDIGIGSDNAKRWLRTGKCSFLPEERQWHEQLRGWGLVDSYRQLHPDIDDRFSWFDYRSRGFDRDPKRGLRIDQLLVTAPLAEKLTGAGIDYEIRGMEKPSDHCPCWAEFDLDLAP